MKMTPFAERLTALLESRGMTRADLAREAGIPYHRLNPWFVRENSKPNGHDVDKVAEALKVSVGHLLNGDPAPNPSARDWILSSYEALDAAGRAQLEGFVKFLLSQKDNPDNGQG